MSNVFSQLRVVVSGEVDSGKSTLIGRFLYDMNSLSYGASEEIEDICQKAGRDFEFAYLLDSFEEERKEQLTIDTTQVFCKTKRGREFVFIDVPGHKELVKNMLCGSSYADTAVLVVDVEKSIEEQTKRHTFILKLLGIEQIIVVLNKMDLVNFNKDIFGKVKEEITDFFEKSEVKSRYFIPISAKQGENLTGRSKKLRWYKGLSLIKVLNLCFKKDKEDDFRFPIQDIYNSYGEKIALGRIISGEIRKADKVRILPLNKECYVRTIKVFNKYVSFARSGKSIGLVLDEMDILRRGEVICKPKLPRTNKEFLAKIFCVHALNIKENLEFKCTTQKTNVFIKKISKVWDIINLKSRMHKDLLEENDVAEVIIVAENPVVIEEFRGFNSLGRFVLEKNREIQALGTVS